MANIIGVKKHLFVLMKGKNGLEKREVKTSSSDYKLKEKWSSHIEKSIKMNKALDKR